MNGIRRSATVALLALVTLTVFVSPAVAANDGRVTTTDAMSNESMTDDVGMDDSMATDSMSDGDSMENDSMTSDAMQGDSMENDSMTETATMDDSGSRGQATETQTSSDGPGFTAGLALVALLGGALLAARQRA